MCRGAIQQEGLPGKGLRVIEYLTLLLDGFQTPYFFAGLSGLLQQVNKRHPHQGQQALGDGHHQLGGYGRGPDFVKDFQIHPQILLHDGSNGVILRRRNEAF